LDVLIDTGAIHSVIAASVLRKLGVTRMEREEFTLADGTKQRYAVGEAFFQLGRKGGTSKVVFAPEGVTPFSAHSPSRVSDSW
jgi:predicted aspartyl protease